MDNKIDDDVCQKGLQIRMLALQVSNAYNCIIGSGASTTIGKHQKVISSKPRKRLSRHLSWCNPLFHKPLMEIYECILHWSNRKGSCVGCAQAERAPYCVSECNDEFRSHSGLKNDNLLYIDAQKGLKKFGSRQIYIEKSWKNRFWTLFISLSSMPKVYSFLSSRSWEMKVVEFACPRL